MPTTRPEAGREAVRDAKRPATLGVVGCVRLVAFNLILAIAGGDIVNAASRGQGGDDIDATAQFGVAAAFPIEQTGSFRRIVDFRRGKKDLLEPQRLADNCHLVFRFNLLAAFPSGGRQPPEFLGSALALARTQRANAPRLEEASIPRASSQFPQIFRNPETTGLPFPPLFIVATRPD